MFILQSLTRFFLFASSLLFANVAMAGANLAISPIQLDLSPSAKTGTITLINKGQKDVNLQLDAKSWDMDESGKFIETETGDFLFYPKTLTIAPQQSATIRAGYTGDFPNMEKPFRIIIDEVPEIIQAAPDSSSQVKIGLDSALRLSIPVYIVPTTDIPTAQIDLAALKTTNNVLRVGVKNLTAYHVNLSKVAVKLLKQNKVLAEKSVDLQLQRVLGNRLVFIDLPMNVKSLCSQVDAIAVQIDASNLPTAYQKTMPLKANCQL